MSSLKAAFHNSDDLTKGIWFSIGFHLLIFVIFGVRAAFFQPEAIDYQAAVRVDIVGLPDKPMPEKVAAPPPKPEEKEEPKPKVEPKPAPKPPAPKVVEKPKAKEPDAVNLEKQKNKEKEALEKLKAMSALDKIKSEVESESHKKTASAAKPATEKVKGNVLSPGTELTGLSKLQHDSYLVTLDHQIKQNWLLPEWLAKKPFRAQIRLKIDEKGQILSREITLSSGNKSYDDLALETIDKSAPFPAPPEKFVDIVRVNGLLIGFPD